MKNQKLKLVGKKVVNTDADLSFLSPKGSFEINASRDESESHEIELADDDRIELQFDDNTTWFGDTSTLHEVFPDMKNKARGDDSFALPMNLQSDDDQRGIGSIALKLFSVFSKNKIQQSVIEIAQKHEKKSLDYQSGLYFVNTNMVLSNYTKFSTDKPILLFLHGTFSSTLGSFGDLNHSDTWKFICDNYNNDGQNRILGFQHETLTKSPLQNVSDLVKQLPDSCKLHVISHSRGGLVGDTLAFFTENKIGFSKELLAIFEKENRKDDLKYIKEIVKTISSKNIQVEKFIRVACPAYGTSLLSKGVDNFFNVVLNIASVATGGNSIVTGCKELINAVLDSKNDASVLPGLEAMNPDSSFLRIINSKVNFGKELESPLMVISGNSALSVSFKALKTLLLRMIFQTDNDLVVNTLSMYQGVRRKNNIQFFFDEGTEVSHMTYFKNDKTRKAIVSALKTTNIQVPGFREYPIEKLNLDDRGALGLEGGSVFKNRITGNRPIVFILPGIMGSNLEKYDKSIWINYFRMLAGGLTQLKINESGIKATSLIKTSYKELVDYLSDYYDVVTVPYDWRRSMKEAGNQFNTLVENALRFNQPIKIVAHSMGGLVARELLLNHQSTWNALNNKNGFKMVLLGTPWLGSFRIPSVLSGNDSIIKMIAKLDLSHSKDELVELFSKFPGILALLPVHGAYDFSKESTWKEFQKASGLNWTIPDSKTIKEFGEFQKSVQDSIKQHRSEMYKNVIYVAGKDDSTPSDYIVVDGKLQIINTTEGDQSVTWASGIPQKIDKLNSLYFVNVTHGGLSCDESIFDGIKELLQFGTTNLFARNSDKIPKTSRGTRAIENDIFEVNEEQVYRTLLGMPSKKRKMSGQMPALKLSVSKGDLQFSSYPILIGHFFKDGIISAEKAADRNLNGVLTQKHSLGIYPGLVGTHLVELGTNEGFNGAIIVGLGQQEDLTVKNLSVTVEKAMMTYMVDCCNKIDNTNDNTTLNGISALLIGSFYGGLPILNSIRAIISGVASANKKIDAQFGSKIKLIEHIEFVELYEDRALQCFNTANKMINAANEDLQIEWLKRTLKSLPGSRKRLLDDNITDWWHRIRITSDASFKNQDERKLIFSSSTDAAREENEDLYTNVNLIESIVKEISEDENWSPEKSITMFELLIPNDFKHNLHSQHNIAWILDKYAASFPWELMQTSLDSPSPLSVGARMVRQLATYDTSKVINPSRNNRALVIGDPKLDGFTRASQLPGAAQEAEMVFEKLKATNGFEIESALINKRKDDIIVALMKTDYKVIHLAGHGIFDATNPNQSGMLIGKQKGKDEPVLLTTKEITQMSSTPELVFVNCCFLGKMDSDAEEMTRDRYKLAANIGTQLIENGVKAVVVAGWAVDDSAALKFAEVFYDNILDGNNFGNSVFEARKSTFKNYPYTNTWGAYQCYGDPFYILKAPTKFAEWKPTYTVSQEAENDLDNLIAEAELPKSDFKWLEEKLGIISKSIVESNLSNAITLEKEAFAYLELNKYDIAIEKFAKLLNMQQANYTITAIERYNNLLTKQAYLSQKENQVKSTIKDFDTIIRNLRMLLEISETPERYSIIGSAYKRKAAVQFWNEEAQAEIEKSLLLSIENYKKAYSIETKNKIYPFCNWVELEAILEEYGTINRSSKDYDFMKKEDVLKILNDNKGKKDNQDYWGNLQNANIELCLCFLDKSKKVEDVYKAYNKAWKVLGSINKKQTEIEHLNLMLDFCYYFDNLRMIEVLNQVKASLLKYLES